MKSAAASPRTSDRILDAAALLFVLGGIALFAVARSALAGIGNGTRAMPEGISAVAVTDFHVAQSRLGLFLVVTGVMVGITAAIRYKLKG